MVIRILIDNVNTGVVVALVMIGMSKKYPISIIGSNS